jgi:hypothetical protein
MPLLSQLIGQELLYSTVVKRYGMHAHRDAATRTHYFDLTILLSEVRVFHNESVTNVAHHVWVEAFNNSRLLWYAPGDVALFNARAFQYTRRDGSSGYSLEAFSRLARWEEGDKNDWKHRRLNESQIEFLRYYFRFCSAEQLRLLEERLVVASYSELCRMVNKWLRRTPHKMNKRAKR